MEGKACEHPVRGQEREGVCVCEVKKEGRKEGRQRKCDCECVCVCV